MSDPSMPHDVDEPWFGDWWTFRGAQLARSGRHYYVGLPPLPGGRRLRQREHACRWLVIYHARGQMIEGLRLRARKIWNVAALPPRPPHGPRCGPGACPDCAARREWRAAAAVSVGAPPEALWGIL